MPDDLAAGPIVLRRFRPSMADAFYEAMAASRDELQRWLVWAGGEPSRERNLAFLEESERKFDADLDWGYAMTEGDGEVVGGCGLHPREDFAHPEIGYWVRSDRTGRGYATSAARALADAAFRNLPYIDHVKVRMDQGNVASAAVPPKLGFRLEREEDRPIETTGHTGRGFVWVLDRPS